MLSIALVLLVAADVPTDPPVFGNPTSITNRYFPFVPGRVKHMETQQGHTDAEDFHVYRTETRTFHWSGQTVPCRILEEISMEDGEVVEISRNYFAQATNGSVYYFGEVVDNYEGGVVVDHGGSWLVGGSSGGDPRGIPDAPAPTVYMPARPEVGDVFKPEDFLPFVDESDLVQRAGISVSTPVGRFTDCIQILESSQISSGTETKWYAPGLGAVKVKEHSEVLVLDSVVDP